MELHEIDVFIEADGQVRLEVRGMKGNACLEATKELEQALGGRILNREMTPESGEASRQTTTPEQQLGES